MKTIQAKKFNVVNVLLALQREKALQGKGSRLLDRDSFHGSIWVHPTHSAVKGDKGKSVDGHAAN